MIIAVVLLIVLLLSLRGLARFYTDYLWFKDVGFSRTWTALLAAKVLPAVIFSAAFFVLMLVNLIVADRIAPRTRAAGPEDEIIERYRGYVAPYAGRVRVAVALFFALIMGGGVSSEWQNWILFSNATKFGIKDPQFHRDISYYVFRLPFEQFAASWVFTALLVVLIVCAVFHYLNGGIRLQSPFQRVTPQVKVHLSVLLALMALTKTVQYYLSQFSLTTSHRGFVEGATYTDVHAQLPALRLLMVISVAAAGLFIVNIWRRGWVFPIIAVGLWGFISIVVGAVYPAFIQRFQVQPNELAREQPYISRNISATRAAFNLSDQTITRKPFDYNGSLTPADQTAAVATTNNIRLYDPAPAKEAFSTRQEFLPFYAFSDVDVDRYNVGNEPNKPTLAAVRELDLSHLPDNSWTSQHLVYTHGYGAVAAGANQVDGDQPSYLLSNIPPTGDIHLDPAFTGVYFGEGLGGYAVVDTKVAEQEVASGGQNVKAPPYGGKAGVSASSIIRRAALALRFGDWNLFVSGQITGSSRVIYIRDIMQRVQMAAPFLKYDADPYPVVLNNRILWVLDAYTTTNAYPYSQSIHPHGLVPGTGLDTDFNYVRNSVKATIDAYDGTIHFYVVDPTDPIVRTYRKAFPNLFEDANAMPAGLRDHWRYPEDIFSAQTEQYSVYHITDPVQFFNKQDIWDVAQSPGTVATGSQPGVTSVAPGRNTTLAASSSPINPLYLTLNVPGYSGEEFALERSFQPRTKANLSAFMFARSDGANYGKLVVYNVSASSAPSPAQAASAIESDQFISQVFTLLGNSGSTVERGDVQLIPIGNTVLYVRPIWVKGEGSQTFPRFRYVAVALGDKAVLGLNVNDALTALVNGTESEAQRTFQSGNPGGNNNGSTTTTTTPSTTTTLPPTGGLTALQLIQRAEHEFQDADAALAKSPPDFATYGRLRAAGDADLAQAAALLASGSTGPSTTVPPGTTAPPGTTTSTTVHT